ncbi:hypothetical protein WOLCODRAFT_158999 [Wolfiporia cocos MD-104 SS10]|uniref:Uncharacterized protein n=1 Tax=Wolfiporia cocos (strain MD-104) TaxID=742152 RepID=A0A2H3JC13_WOLCO|nr:hypothetical protein WOLCODRAFT_158999 [Wolfiporia cocos MD-104 SS10]
MFSILDVGVITPPYALSLRAASARLYLASLGPLPLALSTYGLGLRISLPDDRTRDSPAGLVAQTVL